MRTETYDYQSVEKKWRELWRESGRFRREEAGVFKKFYCLVMFPYPSGKIHMGHARNYCIGDVVARYKRMRGYQVLHPIGWDAFGLPAENAAIERGIDPGEWTKKNISDMGQDIRLLGISYDWEREFATCDPDYYRWNQWFFIQMFKKGLAYRRKSAVNWCPKCATVLANEQVHDGGCWRCHSRVEQKELDQWFLKITDYAERLLDDLKLLEGRWPDEVIAMQRNWIGKSTGAEVDFELTGSNLPDPKLTVFTTRPDTLFGCTFLVVSPEHRLCGHILRNGRDETLKDYILKSRNRTRTERTNPEKEKTGVPTGFYAANPVNGTRIPVWVADYVLSDYGTGAIMAVPAHDQRDFEFAKKFSIPVIEVISNPEGKGGELRSAYEGAGKMVHSGEFSGLSSEEGAKKITENLARQGKGRPSVTYRLRDWLISRQRYWGTPIPIVQCEKCGVLPVDEKDLPVLLPKNVEFTGKGESPLAKVPDFANAACPQCKGPAKRETDTMDTFVDSSWYFLRYCDPKNGRAPFDAALTEKWMPVDQYIGGIEHACMHLIYSRFFFKVIHDLGMAQGKEPFSRLLTQGMVTLGGSAMSKSKGNVVAVEEMAKRYGADTARLFVLFASPPKNQLEWSEEGVQGAWRFLNRVWRISAKVSAAPAAPAPVEKTAALRRKTHQTIKKVTDDIERDFQFNTAISAVMELLNALSDYPVPGDAAFREGFRSLLLLLFPFAPHLTSELWETLAFEPKELDDAPFPSYDAALIREESAEIVVQVNGKVRSRVTVPAAAAREEKKVISLARESLRAKPVPELERNGSLERYKFVPGRLVNFIVEVAK